MDQLLSKLFAMSEYGVEHERNVARAKFQQRLDQLGIAEADFIRERDEEQICEHRFPYQFAHEEDLILHCIMRVIDSGAISYRVPQDNRRRKYIAYEMTDLQAQLVADLVSYYKPALEQTIRDARQAFFLQNKLYSNKNASSRELSADEEQHNARIAKLAKRLPSAD